LDEATASGGKPQRKGKEKQTKKENYLRKKNNLVIFCFCYFLFL